MQQMLLNAAGSISKMTIAGSIQRCNTPRMALDQDFKFPFMTASAACWGIFDGSDKILVVVLRFLKAFSTAETKNKIISKFCQTKPNANTAVKTLYNSK